MDVTTPDGYEATVDISVHEPTFLSMPGQLGPSCVRQLDEEASDSYVSLADATSILTQATTYKTTLKSHDGYPAPVDFEAPGIYVDSSGYDLGRDTNWAECHTGTAGGSFLTAQGAEGKFIEASWGGLHLIRPWLRPFKKSIHLRSSLIVSP